MTQLKERTPIRLNRARSDGKIGSLKRTLERDYGLPNGSVVLIGPDGRPLRSDAYVGTLRARFE